MADISCSCGHWNEIGESTNYCERCGRQLDTDQFTELVQMDAKATRQLEANPAGLRHALMVTFLFAMLMMPISGRLTYWGVVILFFLLWSGFIRWVRKRIFARYHRLWELPETFRPTVPKS